MKRVSKLCLLSVDVKFLKVLVFMKKLLILYSATLFFSSVALLSPSNASANTDDGKIPHVDRNVQFPPTRWQIVRHTIWLHVPKNSKPLTELSINVPRTITISNDIKYIKVTDEKIQEINANISVNNRNIHIVFAEPITSNTKLIIEINNVQKQFFTNSYTYQLFAKVVGINAEIPIGVAQFHPYY